MKAVCFWSGLLLPPSSWLLHLTGSSSYGSFACPRAQIWILNLFTLFCLLLAVLGTFFAWRSFLRAKGTTKRFASSCSLILAFYFLMMILLAGLANLYLEPCQ